MSGYMVCANDDYLKFIYGGKFKGLSYNMWWLVNQIFHCHWVYLELVEVLNFFLGGYFDFAFMGPLMM